MERTWSRGVSLSRDLDRLVEFEFRACRFFYDFQIRGHGGKKWFDKRMSGDIVYPRKKCSGIRWRNKGGILTHIVVNRHLG